MLSNIDWTDMTSAITFMKLKVIFFFSLNADLNLTVPDQRKLHFCGTDFLPTSGKMSQQVKSVTFGTAQRHICLVAKSALLFPEDFCA